MNRSRLFVFVTVMLFWLAASATGQDVADSNKADRDQLTAMGYLTFLSSDAWDPSIRTCAVARC